MKNYEKKFLEDETDLLKLFSILWSGKIFIILISAIFVFLASMYLQNAEWKYSIVYKLKPVAETQQKNSFAGLGGIASFAGIQLPSNSSNDFKIFKELISSVEVSEVILSNKELIKKIYLDEWNSSLNNFSEPTKSKFMSYASAFKRILTGSNEINYTPPNARRLAIYFSENIFISEDKETGFLIIRSETSQPETILSLISEATDVSDKIMRQRYINFSKEPLAFYKEKLRTSRSREHREALAELIGKEEQKLMFASRGKYFTAEPYIDPLISLYPTAPKPKVILFLSLIFGLFVGCGIILLRNTKVKDK